MERIQTNDPIVGSALEKSNVVKKKLKRTVFDNLSKIVAFLFTAILIIALTTSITLKTEGSLVDNLILGAVLAVYYYTMYGCFKDSGKREGLSCSKYIESESRYKTVCKKITELRIRKHLNEWVHLYIERELKDKREEILSQVGISLQEWEEKYRKVSKRSKHENLTEQEFTAIVEANSLKPIKLSPDMLMSMERTSQSRNPIGTNPRVKDSIHSASRLIRACITALTTGSIMLQLVGNVTFANIASVCLELAPGLIYMFAGYRRGFDGINTDMVGYIDSKSDLLEQFVIEYEKSASE